MKPSFYTLVKESENELIPVLSQKLEKALKHFGIPDRERKIKFNEFDNPTIAALVCYELLRGYSQTDKSYFIMDAVVSNIYKSIARAIRPSEFAERDGLKILKEDLSQLSFNGDYYRNDFGYYITPEGKFGGYIFDHSLGSAKNKVAMMIKAKEEFERFTLSPYGSVEFEFNVLSKKVLDENPHLKSEFLEAVGAHNIPELVELAKEYGYLETKHSDSFLNKVDPSLIQKSNIFS